jgi:hypothetical protein
MPSANPAKILRVGVIQGGKIIEERHLKNRETVTVGQDAKNTFVVPASNVPGSFPVFEHRGTQYHLVFTEQMNGRVKLGSSEVDFASLRSQGLAKKRGGLYVLPLNDGAKGKVVLGEVTLLFQFVKPLPEPAKPALPPSVKGSLWQSVDQLFFIVLAGSLLVHFSGAGYLACSPRVEEHELSLDDLPDRFARLIIPTRAPEAKPAASQAAPESDKKETKNEENNNGKKKDKIAGDPTARREQIQQKVVSKGLLRILGSSGFGGAGAFQDVLGGSTGAGDIARALAGAGGVGVATADAIGQGAGRKGGGSGSVAGIGDLGTAGGGNVNLGTKRDVRVAGHVKDVAPEVDSADVDREALARYVRQRLKAIQNCYERELKRNPSLKGKVVVRFSITPSGRSGDIDVEENTLGNEAVASCIRTVIRGWIFPFKPPDNVAVAYPFLFSPAS